MLKARLGPQVGSETSTHLTRVPALARSLAPSLGSVLVVAVFLLFFLLLLFCSTPPQLICQRLSPPLSCLSLLSALPALHSSSGWGGDGVGVGGKLYLQLLPPAWSWEAGRWGCSELHLKFRVTGTLGAIRSR